ncbi:MAG: hypothetical protein ABIH39_06890 [Candidatus Margulisiibacteriota bacterium]
MFLPIFYGFIEIIIQSLLIREIVAQFTTNELIYGVLIALWLLINAGGSLLSRYCFVGKEKKGTAVLFLLLALTMPFLMPGLKVVKLLLNIPYGVVAPNYAIIIAALSSFLIVGIINGILFSMLSRLYQNINRTYLFEGVGFAIGGILFSFVLIHLLSPLQMCLFLSISISLVTLLLLKEWEIQGIVLLIICAFALNFSPNIEKRVNELTWRGYQLLKISESLSGRLTLIKDRGLKTLFLNNSPYAYSYDQPLAEELTYLPLSFVHNPKSILVLGSNRNLFPELQKYQAQKTFIEPDARIIKMYPDNIPLKDIIISDPRYYLQNTDQQYDCILLNLPPPLSMLSSRFYTREFFRLAKKRLAPGGIFALRLPFGQIPEIIEINRSIYKTFQAEFAVNKIIKGTYVHYLGSLDPKLFSVPPAMLSIRMGKAQPEFFDYSILDAALDPLNQVILQQTLTADSQTRINTDLRPVSYFLGLSYWQRLLGSPMLAVLQGFERYNFLIIAVMVLLATASLLVGIEPQETDIRHTTYDIRPFSKTKVIGRWSLVAGQIQGLWSMVYGLVPTSPSLPALIFFQALSMTAWEIILLQYYQINHGFLYNHFPVLIALFMLGLSLGAYWGNRIVVSCQLSVSLFLLLRRVMVGGLLYSLVLTVLIYLNILTVIPLLIIVPGLLLGLSFSIAVSIAGAENMRVENVSARFYAMDLFGGVFGPFLLSAFLIPLNGFFISAVLVCVVTGRNLAALIRTE